MMIKLNSIFVDDQDKALRFYTEVLGFKLKHDFPAGAGRWITVVSAEGSSCSSPTVTRRRPPTRQRFSRTEFP